MKLSETTTVSLPANPTELIPVQLQMNLENSQPIPVERVWQLLSLAQQQTIRQTLVKICRLLLATQFETEVEVETTKTLKQG